MVFVDIAGAPTARSKPVLAPVHDRFLAFAFDVCLWLPIEFLALKPLWKHSQYLAYTAGSSEEVGVLTVLVTVLALAAFAAAQAVTTWVLGATPGKRIFKIEVIDLHSGRAPGFNAAFARSMVWLFEILCLGVPFLEVLSHPERRPWHDRIAETLVVTQKAQGAEAPHWLEQKFFRNIYWIVLSVFVVFVARQFKDFHQAVEHGEFKRAELLEAGYLCREFGEGVEPHDRIDLGIALYLAGQVSPSCLEGESDFLIWTQREASLPWAYLARGFLSSERNEAANAEFAKVCELLSADHPACRLARWKIEGTDPGPETARESWALKYFLLSSHLRQGRFQEANEIMASESWPEPLNAVVQSKRLQTMWLQSEEKEFAVGHELLRIGWDTKEKVANASWACLAELTRRCGGAPASTCEKLREDLRDNLHSDWPVPVLLALNREALCQNRDDVALRNLFIRAVEGDSESAWMLTWLFPRTHMGREWQWNQIYLAAQGLSLGDWLFGQALWALVSLSDRAEQLRKIQDLMGRGASDDPFWWMARNEFMGKARRLGYELRPELKMRTPTSSRGVEK